MSDLYSIPRHLLPQSLQLIKGYCIYLRGTRALSRCKAGILLSPKHIIDTLVPVLRLMDEYIPLTHIKDTISSKALH